METLIVAYLLMIEGLLAMTYGAFRSWVARGHWTERYLPLAVGIAFGSVLIAVGQALRLLLVINGRP